MTASKDKDSAARSVRQSSTGWMLKRLGTDLDAEMSNELKPHGLNLSQFAILMTLLEIEGLTQVELARKIDMPGYATTRMLDVLEERQLLRRQSDERSRRSHRIFLTGDGRALAPQLFGIVKKVNHRLLAPLSESDRAKFADILQQLLQERLG